MTGKRQAIRPAGLANAPTAFSPAVKAAGWVFVSGQEALSSAGDGEWRPRNPHLYDTMEVESRRLLGRLQAVLQAAGCDIRQDVVRIYQWFANEHPTLEQMRDGDLWPGISISPYLNTRNEFIEPPRPASTGMVVRRVLDPRDTLMVDLIAMDSQGGRLSSVETAAPAHVPAPLAGYSPAITRGDWVFLSGEMTGDWKGDYLAERHMGRPSGLAPEARINPYYWYGSEIETQTEYALWKQREIAIAAGTSLDRAVKATVYIGDPSDYEGMDRVWRRWFPQGGPARVVIPYMGLGGDGCRVEIAFKLLTGDSALVRETVTATGVASPFPAEPHAVRCADLLFLSTMAAADEDGVVRLAPSEDDWSPFLRPRAGRAARALLDDVERICVAAGSSLANVCRVQLFIERFEDLPAVLEEWCRRFPTDPPALSVVEVGGPVHVLGAPLLADVIAYAPTA